MERPTPSVKTVTLIELEYNIGDGTPEHPVRRVTSLFRMDGTHIVTIDPHDERMQTNRVAVTEAFTPANPTCLRCGQYLVFSQAGGYCSKCDVHYAHLHPTI